MEDILRGAREGPRAPAPVGVRVWTGALPRLRRRGTPDLARRRVRRASSKTPLGGAPLLLCGLRGTTGAEGAGCSERAADASTQALAASTDFGMGALLVLGGPGGLDADASRFRTRAPRPPRVPGARAGTGPRSRPGRP